MTYKQEVKPSAFRDPKELAPDTVGLIRVLEAQEALLAVFMNGHSVMPMFLRAFLKVLLMTAKETLV